MPIFEYKALTPEGGTKKGIVDADSPKDARTLLRRQQLMVTTIKLARSAKGASISNTLRKLQGIDKPNKKRNEQVAGITRQMASLLASGIPLAESLRALIDQAPDRQLESVFRDVRERVTQGLSLGDALAMHPAYFTPLYCSMVKAGEASGNLDQVLMKLSQFLQSQARMRNKVGAAMLYPMIMVGVGILVIAVLMTFVVPKITAMMKSQDKELPLLTEILITISDFMVNYWWLCMLGIAALIMCWNWILQSDRGRLTWDTIKLKIPVFGDLMIKQSVARFSKTLSTLLRSGVAAVQSIQVTKETLDNKLLQNCLQDVHDQLLEGSDISTPLRASGVFPPMVSYMVAVGEQAGNLEDVLEQIGDTYDEEVDLATTKLTSVIEPLVIVCLASVVAMIILAIVLPLMELQKIS